MVIGWLHTHPFGFGVGPSATDEKTMRSWVRGRGHRMICAIRCGSEEQWYLYYRAVSGNIGKTLLQVTTIGDIVYGKRYMPETQFFEKE